MMFSHGEVIIHIIVKQNKKYFPHSYSIHIASTKYYVQYRKQSGNEVHGLCFFSCVSSNNMSNYTWKIIPFLNLMSLMLSKSEWILVTVVTMVQYYPIFNDVLYLSDYQLESIVCMRKMSWLLFFKYTWSCRVRWCSYCHDEFWQWCLGDLLYLDMLERLYCPHHETSRNQSNSKI